MDSILIDISDNMIHYVLGALIDYTTKSSFTSDFRDNLM